MKTNLARMAVLVVAAATVSLPAFAGQAQTGRVITSDPNDWQYREAMETGNLPADQVDLKRATDPAKDVQVVEYGGIVYRVGTDTP